MKKHMTQTEAAEKLGVSRNSIRYWEKRKMIPSPKKYNNRPVYTKEDLLEISKLRGIKMDI